MRILLPLLIACYSTTSLLLLVHLDCLGRPDIVRFTDGAFKNVITHFHLSRKRQESADTILLTASASKFLDMPGNKDLNRKNYAVLNIVNEIRYRHGKTYSSSLLTGFFYITGLWQA